MVKNHGDCVEVLAVRPAPGTGVSLYEITYRVRSGAVRNWTVRAKDELDAYSRVYIVPE
jgi:hypothetical protein